MWNRNTVSVVLPTYNEKETIRQVVEGFIHTGIVDEIIVVDNNAIYDTEAVLKNTLAKLVYEKRQGYGYAIQRGLKEAKGDIIITSEPDGTFEERDVFKLLAYSDDFPIVFGTRTTSILIWSGANMGWFLRVGNMFVAKMMEFLFNTAALSDVGCTMKLFKRVALQHIKDQFTVGGSHFGPELMLLTIISGIRFIEIPVNYKKRAGASTITGRKIMAFFLGLKMIGLILKYRIKTWLRHPRGKSPCSSIGDPERVPQCSR